jgi:hypothetical protein
MDSLSRSLGSPSHKCVRLSKRFHRQVTLFVITLALFAADSRHANAQVIPDVPDSQLPAGSQNCSPEGSAVAALPNTPSQVVKDPATSQPSPYLESTVPGVRDLAIDSYKKPKTIDRQFLILNAMMVAATVADAETTLNCVSAPSCQEINPLLGSHPTRGRVYAVGVPLTALAIYLSYHYKRVSPSRAWWKAYPLVLTGVHTFGALNNVSASNGR